MKGGRFAILFSSFAIKKAQSTLAATAPKLLVFCYKLIQRQQAQFRKRYREEDILSVVLTIILCPHTEVNVDGVDETTAHVHQRTLLSSGIKDKMSSKSSAFIGLLPLMPAPS